jgi:DNA-directed RNA polymerase subunit E'/Rpb7
MVLIYHPCSFSKPPFYIRFLIEKRAIFEEKSMSSKKFIRRRSTEEPKPELKPDLKPKKKVPAPPPRMKNEIDPEALLAECETFEMDALFDFSTTKRQKTGDSITGTVQNIVGEIALINIGGKSEATMIVDDTFEVGQSITATIVRIDHNGILLAQKIEQGNDLEAYEVAQSKEMPITGKVTDKNSGGYVVSFGAIRGFCPRSQISLRRSEVDHLQQEYSFLITEIKGKELIVSRRSLLEKEHKKNEAEIFASLKSGRKYTGTVQNITDFGIFIAIKGVDGLLPASEINNQEKKFDIGQEVEVILHTISGKRLSLRLATAKREDLGGINDDVKVTTFGDAFSSILDDILKK